MCMMYSNDVLKGVLCWKRVVKLSLGRASGYTAGYHADMLLMPTFLNLTNADNSKEA